MWSNKVEQIETVPLPTDIVKSTPFAKPFQSISTRESVTRPLIYNKPNTACPACNEGMSKRVSSIGLVYHNGFGLCKNDEASMKAEARVNAILHPVKIQCKIETVPEYIKNPESPFPKPKPF